MVWPVYINSIKTRKEGRKIAKEYCVKNPELNEIAKAASRLKFNPQKEDDKSYPSSWWEYSGRVIIETDLKKNDALKKISSLIKKSKANTKNKTK
ncbi:MAG: signal recognition particle subunit SRP19/SEC65 family protein [Methanobrevibacter sp.]|jgi:signal recognition particle subunit SRP19|nr:signal recognition particle subunit SRP19/SEC65 family protein [Methanobrevibacter sp.]